MGLLVTLLIICCLATAGFSWPPAQGYTGPYECSGNGRMVRQFSGRKEDTKMPCKYPAIRQECSGYIISLTPGNIYLYPRYRLDSLWLGIQIRGTAGYWLGRTDNRLAVKYINGLNDSPFVVKSTNLDSGFMNPGKDANNTWMAAYNSAFKVVFTPWDPQNERFPVSRWSFQCSSLSLENLASYPKQICGGANTRESVDRFRELGLKSRTQALYYDVFTNTRIQQMNPQCAEAVRLMTNVCTEDQRRDAIRTCSEILSSYKHTKCVSAHSRDPAYVFVDCVDWVCSGFKDKGAYERLGSAIQTCRNFREGNLTARVEAAKCYRGFLRIRH